MVWSDKWLRERPWREIQEMIRLFRKYPPLPKTIEAVRMRRTLAEYDRRKSEGGGGWAAKGGAL